ncbi:hypothetical protein B0H14DRAFT_3685588 [Mycena olivaceomarginata]|nr:hypothetical protein B0H14DRAFT_3685588 [Mycena olivaceomarginata]
MTHFHHSSATNALRAHTLAPTLGAVPTQAWPTHQQHPPQQKSVAAAAGVCCSSSRLVMFLSVLVLCGDLELGSCVFSASAPLPKREFDLQHLLAKSVFCYDMLCKLPPRHCRLQNCFTKKNDDVELFLLFSTTSINTGCSDTSVITSCTYSTYSAAWKCCHGLTSNLIESPVGPTVDTVGIGHSPRRASIFMVAWFVKRVMAEGIRRQCLSQKGSGVEVESIEWSWVWPHICSMTSALSSCSFPCPPVEVLAFSANLPKSPTISPAHPSSGPSYTPPAPAPTSSGPLPATTNGVGLHPGPPNLQQNGAGPVEGSPKVQAPARPPSCDERQEHEERREERRGGSPE